GEAGLAGRARGGAELAQELGGDDAVLPDTQSPLRLPHLLLDRLGLRVELRTGQLREVAGSLRGLAGAVQRLTATVAVRGASEASPDRAGGPGEVVRDVLRRL